MTRTRVTLLAIAAAALAAVAAIVLMNGNGAAQNVEVVEPTVEGGSVGTIFSSATEALATPGDRRERQRAAAPVHAEQLEKGEPADAAGPGPLRARVIDRISGVPLYKTLCRVVDRNDVAVEAMTDAEGVLTSEEWLMKGPVSLFYLHPSADSSVARRGEHFEFVHGRFQHSGSDAAPDVWEGTFERYVGLVVRGNVIPEGDIFVTLASSDGRRRHVDVEKTILRNRAMASGSTFVEHEMLGFSLGRAANPAVGDWSKASVGVTVRGRMLRAVTIHGEGVYEAEAAVPEIPHWQDGGIELRFLPMTETHPDIIRERYSEEGARHVLLHLRDQRRREELEAIGLASITGVVTSSTGTFRGKTWAIARPKFTRNVGEAPFPRARSLVEWKEGPDGEWAGHFELQDLVATDYVVEVRPATGTYVLPRFRVVTAPHEFPAGTLVVADHIETAKVRILTDASRRHDLQATLKLEYAERSSESSMLIAGAQGNYFEPLTEHTFPIEVPVGSNFTVGITGDLVQDFTPTEFKLEDGVYVLRLAGE
jgi:hypothetical protein